MCNKLLHTKQVEDPQEPTGLQLNDSQVLHNVEGFLHIQTTMLLQVH